MKEYTETDTQTYYDEQDNLYKQCWAADGTTHWGYFADGEIDNLQEAGWLWTKEILKRSEISADSRILEVGCGNGAVAIWLAQETGCPVIGIDISGIRIENAKEMASAYPDLDVRFVCGTITDLPFDDGEFTHVWAQGVLYHIPDLDTALAEVSRVLAPRGILLMDDFVAPEVPVGAGVRKQFYDRLKFEAKYTHREYLNVMQKLQLMPVETTDMGKHIARTYVLVSRAAESVDKATAECFAICGQGTQDREVVGYFYKCVKVADPAQWVYESKSSADIAARYDIWAPTYDRDLTAAYVSPARAAQTFSRYVEDRATPVLDIGCGTGLAGQALAKAGYTNIHGLDMSQGMLEIAEQKQCYSHLFQYDLSADPDIETYRAIISVGCITFGHAPSYVLARIFNWLAPDGIFHITVREDFMEQDLYFKGLLHGLRWDLLDRESWVIGPAGVKQQHVTGLLLKKHPVS